MKRKIVLAMALLGVQSLAWSAEITVAAASSLSDAFKVIAAQFEKQHPAVKVNLTFGSSGTLLQQLRYGAPIDVFASADQKTMNDAQNFFLIQNATRTDFTSNRLVLITSTRNPIIIKDLNELKHANIKHIAIGNPAYTPAGRYAQDVLEQKQLWVPLQPKLIKTQNVRHALAYVVSGETELGFVFASDAQSQANKVRVVMNLVSTTPIRYPIAAAAKSSQPAEAKAFIQYVKSNAAQQVLKEHGFAL